MQIRTNKDGSKTQVVRQYGCNTSSATEPEQSVTYEKNSYVYINAGGPEGGPEGVAGPPDVLPLTVLSSEDAGSYIGRTRPSDDAYSLPRPGTHPGAASSRQPGTGSLGGGGVNASTSYRSHIVRLNSIEPNTVMFSTKDYPILSDVSVPEIIDELEKQFDDKLCELQGVRLVGANVYICLSRKDSLNYLSTYGFYVRGVPVKVVDITNDSVVVCLTGVPHYITDSTVTMLVSTFGIAIGEVERRFYKGVDTGERYVRLKPRAHTQVPDFVTVGGCKILIRVLNNEEVCQPYTLQSKEKEKGGPEGHEVGGSATVTSLANLLGDHQSYNSQTTASFANSSIVTPSAAMGSSSSNYRSKPGHCNGTLNSPTQTSLPQLTTMSPAVSRATDLLLTGIMENSEGVSSPKIAKSFRSRLGMNLRSPPKTETALALGGGVDEVDHSTYVAGDPINDIPSLSPPPYKGPGSTGGSSTTSNSGGRGTGLGLLSRITSRSCDRDDDIKSRDRETGHNSMSRKFNRHTAKTDSSNSLGSHKNGETNGNGCNGNGSSSLNNNTKRSSVVFEEPQKITTPTTTSRSSSSTMPPVSSAASRMATATSRTVNGILRKGSVPGDDIVKPPSVDKSAKTSQLDKDLAEKESSRKNRKTKGSLSKKKAAKLESVTESGMEDGDSSTKDTKDRSSRSRSSSSKTSSSKADKAAKDLALTRDLPWCGCWGNGCL